MFPETTCEVVVVLAGPQLGGVYGTTEALFLLNTSVVVAGVGAVVVDVDIVVDFAASALPAAAAAVVVAAAAAGVAAAAGAAGAASAAAAGSAADAAAAAAGVVAAAGVGAAASALAAESSAASAHVERETLVPLLDWQMFPEIAASSEVDTLVAVIVGLQLGGVYGTIEA